MKDKIIEMNHLNETLFCGCIAVRRKVIGRRAGPTV